jgi:RNA polymerase sigma-70 factor, ECF subfamily
METDIELLNAARMMNKDALVQIFDHYSSALYKYALSLCRDPVTADHIVGDAFEKLLVQFAAGEGPRDNLRSYLYQAVYHRTIDETRFSQRRAPLEVVDGLQPDVQAGYIGLEDQMLFKQVLHAIQNQLTDSQRHVMILRFLEGFSLRDTATIIGRKEDHVKVIQSRAIAKLRKVLMYKEGGTDAPLPKTEDPSKSLRL